MTLARLHILLLFLLALLLPVSGFSAATKWEESKESSARFIVGDYTDGTIKSGIHFKLAKGWKTYWRTPGDAGLPLTVDFSGSENISKHQIKHNILWPFPKRTMDFETIQSYAYEGEVVIPVNITPIDATKPANIKAKATYAVCKELCIFHTSEFTLNIPANHIDSGITTILNKYLARVPQSNGSNGITITSATIIENNILEVRATSEEGFTRPDLLVEVSPDFRFPAAKTTFSEDWKEAVFLTPYEIKLDGEVLTGKQTTLTLINGDMAVEYQLKLPDIIGSVATFSPDSKKNSPHRNHRNK